MRSWARAQGTNLLLREVEPPLTSLCATSHQRTPQVLASSTPGRRPDGGLLQSTGYRLQGSHASPNREEGAYDLKCPIIRKGAGHSHLQTRRPQQKSTHPEMEFPVNSGRATWPTIVIRAFYITLNSRFSPLYLIFAHSTEGETLAQRLHWLS